MSEPNRLSFPRVVEEPVSFDGSSIEDPVPSRLIPGNWFR